ncbi:nucleotidyltransferase [uncultured Aeromicrobium sp.]|uniref:SMODS domain-containing nucleotidyltransferase n=1 Tax=uncultured Aeromicrobium sp. TaxID=337820 RepID=UPI0025F736B1|nr:nucleotidyltransferase [uncultured Aeromicrobium sp.]
MAILSSQFSKALESIEPSADDKANAPEAHKAVRAALTGADELKPWGLNPVLIGSYRRDVSIRRVTDVDVFCRMDDIDGDIAGDTVLNKYFKVLDAEFGTDCDGNKRVMRQARSITIDFPEYDGLHVDAVPARKRSDGYWEIPASDGGWQTTNPEKQTELKTAMNDAFADDYVPLVKLVRQTRRTILASRPGGLFVELALYDACVNQKVSKVNRTLGYVTALEAIAGYLDDKVSWNRPLPDHTMPGHSLSFRATDNQWETARDKFRAAATKAREAYAEEDAGKAAVKFRELLGTNGDGDLVFPMPPGYNDDGTERTAATLITPGESKVPAGDRRFG